MLLLPQMHSSAQCHIQYVKIMPTRESLTDEQQKRITTFSFTDLLRKRQLIFFTLYTELSWGRIYLEHIAESISLFFLNFLIQIRCKQV